MYTVSLVCTAQICLCYFYVSSLCNSVWFGSGCQGRVFHQPKHPSKPADISAFIAPLAEREGLCLCIIHFFLLLFLPFLHLFYISLPFVHRLLVCFASGWVKLRIKNTAPEARNVEQDISLTWVIQKSNSANSVRGGSTILRTKPIWPLALSEQTIIKMFHIAIFLFPSKSLFCNHIVVYVC